MPRENAPRKFGSSGLIFIFVHWCFPVNFVKFLRMPFLQNTSGRLLLKKTCHAGWVFYKLFSYFSRFRMGAYKVLCFGFTHCETVLFLKF